MKHKKIFIFVILILSIILGITLYFIRENKEINYIEEIKDTEEYKALKTINNNISLFKYYSNKDIKTIKVYITEYQKGKIISNKEIVYDEIIVDDEDKKEGYISIINNDTTLNINTPFNRSHINIVKTNSTGNSNINKKDITFNKKQKLSNYYFSKNNIKLHSIEDKVSNSNDYTYKIELKFMI